MGSRDEERGANLNGRFFMSFWITTFLIHVIILIDRRNKPNLNDTVIATRRDYLDFPCLDFIASFLAPSAGSRPEL